MRKFSERERLQIALIGVLALGLFYLLVFSPLIAAERLAAQARLDAAHAAAARLDIYHAASLDGAAEETLRTRHSRLVEALPETRAQGTFIRTVQQRAHASGVTLDAVAPQAVETAEELTMQPIEISFRGGYFETLDFLRALQEGTRAVQFGDLDLKEEGGALRCVLVVRIASLAEKDAKEPPE